MKNIVICSDGTSNEYGRRNSNVVRLYQRLKTGPGQVAFYDPGVGTFSVLGGVWGRRFGELAGKAFGTGIQRNIVDAYRFLMDCYEDGDRVFLFGFSRGAFTVRALAGMLHDCGLLEKGSYNLIPYASRIYNRHDRIEDAAGFKATYSRECRPHLIGVWDTVSSLGWFTRQKRFDARLNEDVKYCYQAVSIDERRRQFPVMLWDERRISEGQEIEQVWFPGCHSDVGGSFKTGVPDIALAWMLERAERVGLCLKDGWSTGLDAGALSVNPSWTGPWRLWAPVMRKMDDGAKVHNSVVRLLNKPGSGYAPRNLPSTYEVVG